MKALSAIVVLVVLTATAIGLDLKTAAMQSVSPPTEYCCGDGVHEGRQKLASKNLLVTKATEVPPAPLSLGRTEVSSLLTLPSPYSGAEMVHPSVVYKAGGWHGYDRWMAVTPYLNADNDYENPSILASNDGVTWEVPSGITNPIVAKPSDADLAAGAYNSDPHMIFSPDGSKLYLLYRYYGPSEPREHIMLMESGDGVTWTSPVAVYAANSTTRRLVAPSIWWDGSQYVILACDILQAGNPFVRLANGGADPYKGWPDAPTNIKLAHPIAGGTWWHGFFILQGNDVAGLIQDGSAGGGNLYLAHSIDDGMTFSVAPFDLSGNFYRSSFVDLGGGRSEVYLGKFSPFSVRRAAGDFDRLSRKANIASKVAALIANAGTGYADDFERADAGTLGRATSGQSYTVTTGLFGISTGRASITTTGNNIAQVDLGAGGYNVRLVGLIDTLGTSGWLLFRATDGANYWRFGKTGTGFRLQKIVAGAVSIDLSVGTTYADTTYRQAPFEIVANASAITILMDGDPLFSTTDSPTGTGTKVGLQGSGDSPSSWGYVVAEKLS